MSRPTRSSNKPLPNTSSIILHGSIKPLPSFLSVRHYPKLGVRAPPQANSQTTTNASGNTKKRARPSLDTSPQKASHNKSKKASAVESTYPPSDREVKAHDEYLRRECIQLISRGVDAAVGDVLRQSSDGPIGEVCRRFLDMFVAVVDDDSPVDDPSKQQQFAQDDEDDESCTHEQIAKPHIISFQPIKYPPTILPMIIIKCYPSTLDRSELVRGLVHDLSNQVRFNGDHDPRKSCVCVLKSTDPLVEQGNLIAGLLYQCTSRDPSGAQFNKHIARQQKRQKSNVHGGIVNGILFKSIFSYTDSLIEWAGCTMEFDELVVLLEASCMSFEYVKLLASSLTVVNRYVHVILQDPENIPSPNLDIFFTTLASLRSHHGVPVSLIIMDCTPGGLGDRLSGLRQPGFYGGSGDGGVMQKVLRMPLPEDQLELFFNKLLSLDCTPSFLWDDETVFNHIQNVFHECDNSIVDAARRFMSELGRYFSLDGSYASILDCKELVLPNWDRVSWLASQSGFKAEYTTASDPTSQLTARITISLVFRDVYQTVISVESTKSFSDQSMMSLLKRLDKARSFLTRDGSKAGESFTPIITKLNEYIILVGEVLAGATGLDKDISKLLLVDIKHYIVSICKSLQIQLPELPTPSAVQPRKDVVKAFSAPIPSIINNSLVHTMRIAFQCFDTRILILSKWYERYFDIVTNHPTISSNESLFFVAVQELVYCGFVKKLTSARRKDEAYEKVAIVWGQ